MSVRSASGETATGVEILSRHSPDIAEVSNLPGPSCAEIAFPTGLEDAQSERKSVASKFDNMSSARVAVILLSLGSCVFLYAIEQTIVATAVSAIAVGVNTTGSLTWISNSYLLTTAVFQPVTGRLCDVISTKRLLISALWFFVIGNIISGTSKSLQQLVVGRLLSGIGGAGLLSLSTIIVSQLTYERQRGSYLNLINVVFTLADSLGPTVGGVLARSGNWRWIFLLNAPFGPLITIALVFLVHLGGSESSRDSIKIWDILRKLDLLGMLTLVATLTFIIIGLNLGGDARPWNSPTVIGLFVAAGCLFVTFVLIENLAESPVVPMGLFVSWSTRNVPIITVTRTLLFFHLFATTFYLPIFLQVNGHDSVISAALVIPFLLMGALASTIANWIASKYGLIRPVFMLGQAILPVGMGLLSTLGPNSGIGRIVGYSLIVGCGFGVGTQTTVVIPQVGLPDDVLPTITAFISSTPNIGGVLGVGIIGTIINNEFRARLVRLVGATAIQAAHISLNDPVTAAQNSVIGDAAIHAYLGAWRLGFQILAGIAAFQFFLCISLRQVVLRDGSETKPRPELGEDNDGVPSIALKKDEEKIDTLEERAVKVS